MKKMYKIRLQRDFFETCNKCVKWYGLSVDINILCPEGIKSWKKNKNKKKKTIKSYFKDIFETCNKWMKWQDISVDIKTLTPRGCLSLPRGYIHV